MYRAMSAMVCVCLVFVAEPLRAQGRPAPVVESPIGWAAFLDDAVIDHGVVGASARVYVTPRVSVGPEVVFMMGPGTDRDLFVTGNVMLDLRPPDQRPRRVTPFVVAGAGLFQNRSRLARGTFVANDPGLTAGAGVRIWVTDRLYVAPEARTGWEPHLRLTVTVGMSLGPR